MDQIIDDFKKSLLDLNRLKAENIIHQFEESEGTSTFLEKLIVPAMEEIGQDWDAGNVALTQVYMSGRICEEILESFLPGENIKKISHPPMAIVVLQDHHLLGKRIVASVLKASGYELMDYGSVDNIDELIVRISNDKIRILLISTLMLHSALRIKELHEKIIQNAIKVKIIVGGAPFRFDSQLWEDIGADAMATNASDGIRVVANIVKEIDE